MFDCDHLMAEFGVFGSGGVFYGYVKGFSAGHARRRWDTANFCRPADVVLSKPAAVRKLAKIYRSVRDGEL